MKRPVHNYLFTLFWLDFYINPQLTTRLDFAVMVFSIILDIDS